VPLFALWAIATRAVEVGDALCWDLLEHGQVAIFVDAAAIAAEL